MGKTTKQQHGMDDKPIQTEKQRRNHIELEAWKLALKKTRKTKFLLIAVIVCSVLALFIGIKSANDVTEVSSIAVSKIKEVSETHDKGRQVAVSKVNSWLTGSATPFPGGFSNLMWDSATLVSTQTDSSDGTTDEYWSHQLSFTDSTDGSTRTVAQLVMVSGEVETAVGEPSILPATLTGTSSAMYKPTGYLDIDTSDNLQTNLGAWAKAYVGKDRNALTVSVGDPNPDNVYQPAEVGTYQGVSVNWVVECDRNGNAVSKDDSSDSPAYGAASITVTFKPYPVKEDDGSTSASSNAATMSLTVLIANPASGNARVVDWAADGLLTTLKPYANAVDKSLASASSSEDEEEDEEGTSSTTENGDTTQTPSTDSTAE